MVLTFTLVALATLSGCDEANPITATSTDLASEMAGLVLETDQMTEEIVGAELSAMGVAVVAVTEQRTFSGTRSCPGGGEFMVEGSIVRTSDPATGVVEAEISGSRTRIDCVFIRGDFTITVNSSAAWEKFRRRLNGVPDGPQTSHYFGSWTAVRSDGEERTCTFDYTVVRDPDTQTRTVEGTICLGGMRRVMGWNPN
jgi:hypothetical protein